MSKPKLHLTLKTPFLELLDEAVEMVIADTDEGQLTFLPEHASVSGAITAGKIEVRWAGHDKTYFARQGVFDLDNHTGKLKIMVLECELVSDIEIQSVKEHLQEIENDLANPGELSEMKYRYLADEKVAVEKMATVIGDKRSRE